MPSRKNFIVGHPTSHPSDTLRKIKRALLAGNYEFSQKAFQELIEDGLSDMDVVESITSAVAIYKTLRSTSAARNKRAEKLYVIISTNLDGMPVYTKGKFVGVGDLEHYYFLISSKKSRGL